MKKTLLLTIALLFASSQLFASYMVVLKDGTRYRAKERYKVTAGKALIALETGTTLQLDVRLIDAAKTDEANRSGLGDAKLIAVGSTPTGTTPQSEPSIASLTQRRNLQPIGSRQSAATAKPAERPAPVVAGAAPTPNTPGSVGPDVISRFAAAYENVGIFGVNVVSTSGSSIKVEMIADTEDQVFKAISATSYVMARIPSNTGTRLDLVELFMATIKGGAAGRFQMTMADAEAIDKKQLNLQAYFIAKVLY